MPSAHQALAVLAHRAQAGRRAAGQSSDSAARLWISARTASSATISS
jgi:hypothetical protein